MVSHPGMSQRNWLNRLVFLTLATLAIANVTLVGTRAADLSEQAHSLKKVPADAAFYTASMRFKEQVDAFLASKAYGKLMEIPFVQIIKLQITFQWQQSEDPTIAKLREYVESPAGQDAVGVLSEMFSDEVFAYGGNDIAESLGVLMEINSMRRTAKLEALAKGKPEKEVLTDHLFEILEKHSDKLKVPTFVLGFRIKDQARAKRELDEVHSLLRNLMDQADPDLAGHLQRDQVAGNEYLTLRLDGSMIPWEKIKEEANEEFSEEQFEKIKGFVSKQKLVVALGVTDEFVILSIGETTDHLEKMGSGAPIADVPAIKRLEKHAGERLVAINYVSKKLGMSMGSAGQTVQDLAEAVEDGLVKAEVSEEHRKQIAEDIQKIDLSLMMPEPGDSSGAMFLTNRGYEGFQYSDVKPPMMDSSKPLSILNHVGGNPMLVFASRSKENIDQYKSVIAWLTQVTEHVEQIAKEKADEDDWNKYQEIRKRTIVLLERLDKANRDHLYPALADGQGAIVVDVEGKSKQWFKQMPESPKPLPMFELGFAASVSDAEHLRLGVAEYIDVAVEAYNLIKEYNPKEMPELNLPKADITDLSGGGKLYNYPLPEQWGVDSQVSVNAGLTNKFVVVSTMPKTTERLLHDTTPDLDTSLKLDRPAAMVVHMEFAKLIQAIEPWIDYGVDVATGKIKPKKEEGEEEDKPAQPNPMALQLGFVVPQVHQVLQFVSAFRSATSISYEEEGVWVTHSETHLQDLK